MSLAMLAVLSPVPGYAVSIDDAHAAVGQVLENPAFQTGFDAAPARSERPPAPASPPPRSGLPDVKPPPVPQDAGGVFRAVLWVVLIAGGILLAGAVLHRAGDFLAARRHHRTRASTAQPHTADEPAPTGHAADPSLREADRLAAQGLYGEAVHVLLAHAVRTLAERHAARARPSLTGRELVGALGLPPELSKALSHLVRVVELSHFGGRPIDRAAYSVCAELSRQFTATPARTG